MINYYCFPGGVSYFDILARVTKEYLNFITIYFHISFKMKLLKLLLVFALAVFDCQIVLTTRGSIRENETRVWNGDETLVEVKGKGDF